MFWKLVNLASCLKNEADLTANILTNLFCRVLMLGAPGVGKSSICAQFLSSEHINAYDKVGEKKA